MNRREAITNATALAVGALIPGTKLAHGQDLSLKNRTSGATKVYSECATLDDNSPIHSVRITVTLKDDAPHFWHPLDFAKAAQWASDREREGFKYSSNAFGPHDDTKFTFKS
jgi:hypothetical protein